MKTKKKSWFLIVILILPLIEKMFNLLNEGKSGIITVGLAIASRRGNLFNRKSSLSFN